MKYCKIKSIREVPSEPIYHLSVEKNNNFFGNDICLHNCDFRNELMLIISNIGREIIEINDGDRIAQCWIEPVYQIRWNKKEELPPANSNRIGGIGSTGVS